LILQIADKSIIALWNAHHFQAYFLFGDDTIAIQ